jgi:hypothetical protein
MARKGFRKCEHQPTLADLELATYKTGYREVALRVIRGIRI